MNYTLFGDNGQCPDCVVLMANPMDGSRSTVQRTLYCGTDDGWQFWKRIMTEARELVRPMGYGAHVAIFCGTPAHRDSVANYRRSLLHVMDHDRSHKLRVSAASQLLDLHARTLQ